MSKRPSIKGSVMNDAASSVRKLLDTGGLSRDDASRWLEPSDFELLEESIQISSWYDIGAFVRMNELMREVEGGGDNEYLVGLGRDSAQRLLDGGLYGQLDYLSRLGVSEETDAASRFESFERDLRLLVTLARSIYDFSTWTPGVDPAQPHRYIITLTEAEAFVDVVCWRVVGFMNQMASNHDSPNLWAWKRTARDVVQFYMVHDV